MIRNNKLEIKLHFLQERYHNESRHCEEGSLVSPFTPQLFGTHLLVSGQVTCVVDVRSRRAQVVMATPNCQPGKMEISRYQLC